MTGKKSMLRSLGRTGLAAMVCLICLPACGPKATQSVPDQPQATALETRPSPLADQVGQSVYFHGQFDDQVSDAIFLVREDESRGWGQVLVLNRAERSFQVPANVETPLWIYGTVDTMTEDKLRENQVEQSQWSSYEGLPVVIAKHLTLVPSPSELVNNPEAFLNQRITVYGEIEPSDSAKTFILKNPGLFGGKGIIVIQGATADLSQVSGPDRAVVTGVLRRYEVAKLKEEYALTWDLTYQEKLEADFEQSPVIIADAVYPVQP